jgi:hypothetical protein
MLRSDFLVKLNELKNLTHETGSSEAPLKNDKRDPDKKSGDRVVVHFKLGFRSLICIASFCANGVP